MTSPYATNAYLLFYQRVRDDVSGCGPLLLLSLCLAPVSPFRSHIQTTWFLVHSMLQLSARLDMPPHPNCHALCKSVITLTLLLMVPLCFSSMSMDSFKRGGRGSSQPLTIFLLSGKGSSQPLTIFLLFLLSCLTRPHLMTTCCHVSLRVCGWQTLQWQLSIEEATQISVPFYRSTYYPLAVLMEALCRCTGAPTLLALDCFTSVLTSLLHKDLAVACPPWETRARYWTAGSAAPGCGKNPALDPFREMLQSVLAEFPHSGAGDADDSFHVQQGSTHAACLDHLRAANGYLLVASSEAQPLLCPQYPVHGPWDPAKYIALNKFLDAAYGKDVEWSTMFDRKARSKPKSAPAPAQAASSAPPPASKHTNVAFALLFQDVTFRRWWAQAEHFNPIGLTPRFIFSFSSARAPADADTSSFAHAVAYPWLRNLLVAVLKSLGPGLWCCSLGCAQACSCSFPQVAATECGLLTQNWALRDGTVLSCQVFLVVVASRPLHVRVAPALAQWSFSDLASCSLCLPAPTWGFGCGHWVLLDQIHAWDCGHLHRDRPQVLEGGRPSAFFFVGFRRVGQWASTMLWLFILRRVPRRRIEEADAEFVSADYHWENIVDRMFDLGLGIVQQTGICELRVHFVGVWLLHAVACPSTEYSPREGPICWCAACFSAASCEFRPCAACSCLLLSTHPVVFGLAICPPHVPCFCLGLQNSPACLPLCLWNSASLPRPLALLQALLQCGCFATCSQRMSSDSCWRRRALGLPSLSVCASDGSSVMRCTYLCDCHVPGWNWQVQKCLLSLLTRRLRWAGSLCFQVLAAHSHPESLGTTSAGPALQAQSALCTVSSGSTGNRSVQGALFVGAALTLLRDYLRSTRDPTLPGLKLALRDVPFQSMPSDRQIVQYLNRYKRSRAALDPLLPAAKDTLAEMRVCLQDFLVEDHSNRCKPFVLGEPTLATDDLFVPFTCRGMLACLTRYSAATLHLAVDAKMQVVKMGLCIATLSLLVKPGLRKTTLLRLSGVSCQAAAFVTSAYPVLQALMHAETSKNYERLFRTCIGVWRDLRGTDPVPLVTQVHKDFSKAIEHARALLFPASRPVDDWFHLRQKSREIECRCRSTKPQGGKFVKEHAVWILTALDLLHVIPTPSLFRALWHAFVARLQAMGEDVVAEYLSKEYTSADLPCLAGWWMGLGASSPWICLREWTCWGAACAVAEA